MLNFIWESLLTWLQGAVIATLDKFDAGMLYAFSPRLITMDQYFPALNGTWDIIVSVSFAMVLALCIFKIFQNSFMTLSKSYENPAILILRSIFALVVITTLPILVKYIFEFADTVYWSILSGEGAENLDAIGSTTLEKVASAVSGKKEEMELNGRLEDLFNPSDGMPSLASFLITFIMTVAIVWNYFKLLLEIAERYVVLGIMYYTMPLAAVPLVSRDTSSITKSWLRMLVSELMILVLNVWFVMVFRGAILNGAMSATEYEVNGHTVGSGLLWCFLAVAFLKTAQKIDSHIATLGLTTAQLSSGIGATLLATGMGIRTIARGTSRGVKGIQAFAGKTFGKSNAFSAKAAKREDADMVSQKMQKNGSQYQGIAAVEAVKNGAANIVKGKNITSAKISDNGEFIAHYKDANGNDATISFTKEAPNGASKRASYGDMQGFVQDTGSPFKYDDINNGKTTFNEFAEENLGGSDNVISASGKFSQEDLDGATVSADPSGDGVIIKDKDGFEMARLSKFDDEHADNITDDTLIGEFADGGLYRADINTDERYPLPDGYSYAGEVLVDNDGNAISEVNSTGYVTTGDNGNGYENLSGEFINSKGEIVSDAHYQDSYRTADGNYISADEMQSIMSEKTVSPSDYADNIQYSQDKGFTDISGNAVNMEKAGWIESETDPGVYNNQFTGGSATGEQIAEHYSNPEFASKSYGGFSDEGKEMYFDNYSKDSLDKDNMGDERKYGEKTDYTNFTSGAANGPRNFSESVETLMNKEYSFSGQQAAKIAQEYMPELKNSNVEKAYITKDSIKVDKTNGDGIIQRESYASEIGAYATSGSFARVESAGGQKTWLKSTKGNSRAATRENHSKAETNSNPRSNPFSGNKSNPKDNRGARGGRKKGY